MSYLKDDEGMLFLEDGESYTLAIAVEAEDESYAIDEYWDGSYYERPSSFTVANVADFI